MDPRHPQGLIRARHRQGLKRRRAPPTGESDSRTTGVRHRGRAGRTPTPGGSPMADIYAAQLSPSKVEVVTEWVTGQDWRSEERRVGEGCRGGGGGAPEGGESN